MSIKHYKHKFYVLTHRDGDNVYEKTEPSNYQYNLNNTTKKAG